MKLPEKTKNKLKSKKILLIKPQEDSRGFQGYLMSRFDKQFRYLGLDTICLDQNDRDFPKNLFNALNEKDVFHFGLFFYDMLLHSFPGLNNSHGSNNVFELLDIPTFPVMGDHAFAKFMISRMSGMPSGAHVLYAIHDIKDELALIRKDINSLSAFPQFSLAERVIK